MRPYSTPHEFNEHPKTQVNTRLHAAGSPRIKTTLTKLLTAAAHGVASNATATAPVLAALAHELLSQGLALEEATVKRIKGEQHASTTAPTAAKEEDNPPAPDEGLHVHLLVEFALQVLHTALRKGPLTGREQPTLDLLNPLLPMFVRCLACRHAATVSLALRCMALLIDLPLAGTETAVSCGVFGGRTVNCRQSFIYSKVFPPN